MFTFLFGRVLMDLRSMEHAATACGKPAANPRKPLRFICLLPTATTPTSCAASARPGHRLYRCFPALCKRLEEPCPLRAATDPAGAHARGVTLRPLIGRRAETRFPV